MARLVNALLLALVAVGYGLWFGARLAALPFGWVLARLRR